MGPTADELENIGAAISNQLINLQRDNNERVLTLFREERLLISSDSTHYFLKLIGIQEFTQKVPEWISIESSRDTIISIPHKYNPELEYFLRKSFEEYLDRNKKGFEMALSVTLDTLYKIWLKKEDIISEEMQRGLIGEISTVSIACKLRGLIAVEGWDETSHSIHDIMTEEWHIEAKTKSLESTTVLISSPEQLSIKDNYRLILSVTDVSKDKNDGLTLPEFVDDVLIDLSSSGSDGFEKLRNKISYYPISKMRDYFSNYKWRVGETRFYEIAPGSVPDEFPDTIPPGIIVKKYRLDLQRMSIVDLNSII